MIYSTKQDNYPPINSDILLNEDSNLYYNYYIEVKDRVLFRNTK